MHKAARLSKTLAFCKLGEGTSGIGPYSDDEARIRRHS